MKKIVLSMIMLMVLQGSAWADNDDKVITERELPKASQSFLKRYFENVKISIITMDDDFLDKDYKVSFSNGHDVSFDKRGNWTEVDCEPGNVPEGVVPDKIRSYVVSNYPNESISKIERDDKRGYEIKLSNRISMKFNSSLDFVGFDD